MTTLLHPEYHTITRRLYPTTEQKLQLAAQFDLQDHAFNEWADLANNGVLQGKSYETIQREIEAHLIPTDRARIAMRWASSAAMCWRCWYA